MISAVSTSTSTANSPASASSDPEKELMAHFDDLLSQLLSGADKLTQAVQSTEQNVMKASVDGEATGETLAATSTPGLTYSRSDTSLGVSTPLTTTASSTTYAASPMTSAASPVISANSFTMHPIDQSSVLGNNAQRLSVHTHHSAKVSHNYSKSVAERQSSHDRYNVLT